MPFIHKMKLHYRILGEGPTILVLHGLFGMSDNWQSFGRQLAERNFRVFLIDLRNHGHSLHTDRHTYQNMAADIAELIEQNTIDRPIVMGHSMGGKVCLQCLIDFPGMISKAIVVDIAPWHYAVHHREILDALLAVDLPHLTSRLEAEKMLGNYIKDIGTKQFFLKNLYRKENNEFGWRFNLKTINEQIEEIGLATWPLQAVHTPVLFIRGENSTYIDPYRMNEILHWYPEAELVNIPGAGHWVHADQPALLLEEIVFWLKK